ncbi:hypothetical protein ASZ78_007113, partial [Callipepla squamata]
MQYLNDKKEVSQHPTTCGKDTDVRTKEHKSPEAPGCPTVLQQCPLEYITTDSLSLPSARDTTHLPLVTAGEQPCDPQELQPSSDCSCHEVTPGKSDVTLSLSGQVPASPETHGDAFGDYLDVHSGLHGPSELTKTSLPFQLKGSTLPKEQPLSEGNLVVLNPDSTEPVFLCQTVQIINITNDEPPFIFTDQMLSPSTKYRGKMRARVNNLDYQGYWSEWSEEFTWETENALSPLVLPLILPALIITLLVVAYCSYKYFL